MKQRLDAVASHTLFLFIVAFFAILIAWFPFAYIIATYEDLLGEWTQFYFFAIALLLSARLVFSGSPYRFFFACIALACFYVCGEEISWGQRLFGFATPDFFQQHNLQQEANLHNFFTGPSATPLKRFIEISLSLSLLLYGVVYPLELTTAWKPVLWLKNKGIPAPPVYLWPFFTTGALLELRLFKFNEAEIAEILISLALVFFICHYLIADKQTEKTFSIHRKKALCMVVLFFLGTGLGAATTALTYRIPRLKVEMDERIHAGIKKFGERYGRYNSWQNSANLYKRLLEDNGKDTETLRNLAHCSLEMGRQEEFKKFNTKAIYIDMAKYGRFPGSTAVNLSLYKTFQQAKNSERAEFHLMKALQSSKEKVMLEPENPWANFLLGQSYLAVGDPEAALTRFNKAVLLRPHSKTFQKAVEKARIQCRRTCTKPSSTCERGNADC